MPPTTIMRKTSAATKMSHVESARGRAWAPRGDAVFCAWVAMDPRYAANRRACQWSAMNRADKPQPPTFVECYVVSSRFYAYNRPIIGDVIINVR